MSPTSSFSKGSPPLPATTTGTPLANLFANMFKRKVPNEREKRAPKPTLLTLPAEIRNQIYESLFEGEGFTGSDNLRLLLTCKQINDEATFLAWTNTTFAFKSIDKNKLRTRLLSIHINLRRCAHTLELPYIQMNEVDNARQLKLYEQIMAEAGGPLGNSKCTALLDESRLLEQSRTREILYPNLQNLEHLICTQLDPFRGEKYFQTADASDICQTTRLLHTLAKDGVCLCSRDYCEHDKLAGRISIQVDEKKVLETSERVHRELVSSSDSMRATLHIMNKLDMASTVGELLPGATSFTYIVPCVNGRNREPTLISIVPPN
ncbi:hypothetical protein EJ08DRAFT_675088 [Tothia fuscella]|uniref:Uncharacterized protein n=1 Tax=Tothia fuscella TaxID=1048955 RepID=A0A9P4P2T4_9PEZI|nr:hypothetical protein EJ08DRAFT_675088 [Tothia fuscella]